MENYVISQGSTLVIDVTLRDWQGEVVDAYSGLEPLSASLWPGGSRTELLAPLVEWTDASNGLIAITITDVESATLEPGRYQLLARLDDGGLMVDVYSCTIEVEPEAGIGAEPRTYCASNDLQLYARAWLGQLQTEEDEAGWIEQRARARTWLESMAQNRWATGKWGTDPWLQDRFDNDELDVTDEIREATAKYALYLICSAQVGVGGSSAAYSKLATMYMSQAESILSNVILEVKPAGVTFPVATIDLSSCPPNRG